MSTPPFKTLLYSSVDHVCTVTMNRPEKRNALSAQLVNELIVALETAAADQAVRVVILQGAGGAFCAGADLSLMAGGGEEDPDIPHRGGFPELNLAMRNLGLPIISKVERYAMAGALALICNSTFVIAEETAKFSAPEIDRGLFPMMVLASLFRTVSKRHGLDLVLTGRKFLAPEAVQMGLINRAVPAMDLDGATAELANTIANKPPAAIRMGLAAYHQQENLEFSEALPYLQEQLMEVLGTEDAQEGIMAFLQKRPPEWKGR
jgi:enoyl-CoA hydratase/carnithine racemase